MPFFLLMLAIQVFLIVDVIRNGRHQLWIMALVFLPLASTIAYVVIEVLPRFQHNRHVRAVHAQLRDKLDPERELRAARSALDVADTVSNRTRAGEALAALGRHEEAVPLFRRAVGGGVPDRHLGELLARSQFLSDDPTSALATLDAMRASTASADVDRVALLRARILEDLGREAEALPIYADVAERLTGDEARCRHAALLLKMGRKADARVVLDEVERRAKRLSRQQRAGDGPMYDWAAKTLASLRT